MFKKIRHWLIGEDPWPEYSRLDRMDGLDSRIKEMPVGVTRTQEELVLELIARFGTDPYDWAFVCPNCGDVATGRDWRKALDENGFPDEDAARFLGQECIGRMLGAISRKIPKGEYTGRGCDWAAYGLFQGPDFVVTKDGKKFPAFALAAATKETVDG